LPLELLMEREGVVWNSLVPQLANRARINAACHYLSEPSKIKFSTHLAGNEYPATAEVRACVLSD
jgi:hypothetical protein